MNILEFPTLQLPIQSLAAGWLSEHNIQLSVLRADLADPLLSGNKYFKLKYNLVEAARLDQTCLLSFGGAWSNHLHALAAAGQRFGFATIGIVRGEPTAADNACLRDAARMGMQLQFVSRAEYQQRNSPEFIANLRHQHGDFYLIPEGGANLEGIRGCQELLPQGIEKNFTHLALACGTGTTMAGLISSSKIPVIGIQVLKGNGYLQAQIANMLQRYNLQPSTAWTVLDTFHHGGYAKVDTDLLTFIEYMARETDLPLEPVYSGKLFWALRKLIAEGYFPPESRILAIHGGGLQGSRGFLVNSNN
jgi:1-aminocyclopropane-1-carboxylate deaminase/D-cysteine desulfhydrase-like pyridoxal-dependent ACC family enzyme